MVCDPSQKKLGVNKSSEVTENVEIMQRGPSTRAARSLRLRSGQAGFIVQRTHNGAEYTSSPDARLDRDSVGRQTSANAGRATDFTDKCITRGGGLSILKCDGYSIRTSWQVLYRAGVAVEVVRHQSSVANNLEGATSN